MIELARRKPAAKAIRFDVGDAQALPYDDASFDVVSSAFAVIFAPDHARAAGELARVCARRLGLTSWKRDAELRGLYVRFGLDSPEGAAPFEWGREERVHELLGAYFELEIVPGTWFLETESGADAWAFWSSSAPPFKAMVDGLDPDRRAAFRAAYVEYCESFRVDGGVRVPREFLLILGRRR
jgi:ubiquinone/menaquinone biosynthesis C-methylase UbiE